MGDQPVFDKYKQTVFPDPVAIPVSVPPPALVITMRHFVKLDGALGQDVIHAFLEADARHHFYLEAAEESNKPRLLEETRRARRNATRALFAWIEALVWNMKQTALSLDSLLPKTSFTPAETAVLREKEYVLKKTGEADERTCYVAAAPNLRLAFAMFGRPYGSAFELKVGDVEWEAYLKALEIRDRLTHPKKPADIKVSDDEYSKVLHVTRTWFARNFNEALDGLLSAQAKRTGGARIEIALDGEPSEEEEPSS